MIAVAALMAACGSDSSTDTSDSGNGAVVLTEANNGEHIVLDAGELFEVRLESNASTGYTWEISAVSGPRAFELRTRTYMEPDTDLVGAPGADVFNFEAISGAEVLRFEYVRSFEDPAIPERVIEYIIRVDEAPWPPEDVLPPATSSAIAPIEVAELLEGPSPTDASVVGFVIVNDGGARLCEALAESFPPQCGGSAVVIANPEALTVALEQEQGVRWTNERVRLDGTYDGTQFTLIE
jgi:predicted secreted protein